MSGGISAIKGFDYQATVILDLLRQFFSDHGLGGIVRPEGVDDLDFQWSVDGISRRQFIQIKKPMEDKLGNQKTGNWTLKSAIAQLFPKAIASLAGNGDTQVWILGNAVSRELKELLASGINAPSCCSKAFLQLVHAQALENSILTPRLSKIIEEKLRKWKASDFDCLDTTENFNAIAKEFGSFAIDNALPNHFLDQYNKEAARAFAMLPEILSRIEVRDMYGTENIVATRVQEWLQQSYSLSQDIVEKTVFRNLRGFINDISKQPGRAFNLEEFEVELRCVWPSMTPIKVPPAIEKKYVRRIDLVRQIVGTDCGTAIDVTGVSGAGKTMLASEVMEYLTSLHPDVNAYYVEARQGFSLRDVLAGLAYALRRIGVPILFKIATKQGSTSELIIKEFADAISSLELKIILLIDFVEGSCGDLFARDIKLLVEGLQSNNCAVISFSQDSAFREMNQLELSRYNARTLDLRGFRFEEFCELISYYHSNFSREDVWVVFERATAGRAAGLYVKLAHSLATATSTRAMLEAVSQPAEDMLPYAETQRFARISSTARSAAEKIVCFVLPFFQEEAKQIFLHDNVGLALRELRALGMIRKNSDGSFELHETVRAGLESTIAYSVQKEAHRALAQWYKEQCNISAYIYHLDKLGLKTIAEDTARENFLKGKFWDEIYNYVVTRRLVTAKEIVQLLINPEIHLRHYFYIPAVVRQLGIEDESECLLNAIENQIERFSSNYSWAASIAEILVRHTPKKLLRLIDTILKFCNTTTEVESAIAHVCGGAQRVGLQIEQEVIDMICSQPLEKQKALSPLLLLDKRRHTFELLIKIVMLSNKNRHGNNLFLEDLFNFNIQTKNLDETIELLAAIPLVSASAMMVHKSALFEEIEKIIWSNRHVLRAHCAEILKSDMGEQHVLANAIRVLVYLADTETLTAWKSSVSTKSIAEPYITAISILIPELFDKNAYINLICNQDAELKDRINALWMLAMDGRDISQVFAALVNDNKLVFDKASVQLATIALFNTSPFDGALPIVEEFLNESEAISATTCLALIQSLSRLPSPRAGVLLIGLLDHRDKSIRRVAAWALSRRRDRGLQDQIIEKYKLETDWLTVCHLAAAITACRPAKVTAVDHPGLDTEEQKVWRCIIAARTGDKAFVSSIVDFACSPVYGWKLRRAAILAAASFPYELALEKIVFPVFQQRSSLTIDESANYWCHQAIHSILSHMDGVYYIQQCFLQGEEFFIGDVSKVLEARWEDIIHSHGLPAAPLAAKWLFSKLSTLNFLDEDNVLRAVINELSLPLLHSAMLRSLRVKGKTNIIEMLLKESYSSWFSVKCVKEILKIEPRNREKGRHLKKTVSHSEIAEREFVDAVIDEYCNVANGTTTGSRENINELKAKIEKSVARRLQYDAIVRILTDPQHGHHLSEPFFIDSLTCDQLSDLAIRVDRGTFFSDMKREYVPKIKFTSTGFVVSEEKSTSGNGDGYYVKTKLCAALAAANRFEHAVPWHRQSMINYSAQSYISELLKFLSYQDDAVRFYEELYSFPDLIGPFLCDERYQGVVAKYIDKRILPFLQRYVFSGSREFFCGLCRLAAHLVDGEIDYILAKLFGRWSEYLSDVAYSCTRDERVALWRAFDLLSMHPRFEYIAGWQDQLSTTFSMEKVAFHRQEIFDVLKKHPRSYVDIELKLIDAMDFTHVRTSELDELSDAAEALFFSAS